MGIYRRAGLTAQRHK